MKKLIKLSLLFLLPFAVNAQELISKVPQNAIAVAKINANNFFRYLPADEFNKSFIGKSFLAAAFTDSTTTVKDVQNFGINLSASAYYYYQQTDSIGYNVFLLPIKDVAKLDQFSTTHGNKFTQNGDLRKMANKDSSTVVMWNKDVLYVINASLKDEFFKDSLVAKRYGIENVRFFGQDDDIDVIDSILVDTATVITTTEVEEVEEEEMDEVAVAKSDEMYDDYYKKLAEQTTKKNALKYTWLVKKVDELNNGKFESINTVTAYTSRVDHNALASVWLANIGDLYSNFIPRDLKFNTLGILGAYKSLNANLYADNESIRINTEVEIRESEAQSFAKMYKHKLNRKFFKYVNSEKTIGMLSYALNTEAYLKEIPKLMMSAYGTILGGKEEEVALGAEFFSLLLDEKAIAKVVKGDALFLVNDLSSREVSYTGYEYDEDYKSIEVQKTKTETLPNFLMMFSSDDTSFFDRLLKIGMNRNLLSVDNNIYKIEVQKGIFDVYFLIKDKIVFCGTSLKDLQEISSNNYSANISKKQKNLLSKNNFTAYFSAKNSVGKIPKEEIGNIETLLALNKTLGGMGDIYIKSNGIKGNIVSGEMVSEVPAGHQNAIKYLFSLIENAQQK